MVDRRKVGNDSEQAAARSLRRRGFAVTDLNALSGNAPCADLLAIRPGVRGLVQVRGTTVSPAKWAAEPTSIQNLMHLARSLDCVPLYAFVSLHGRRPAIGWMHAKEVLEIAQAGVDSYAKVARYHIHASDQMSNVKDLGRLLLP